jgi:hypothetical protein
MALKIPTDSRDGVKNPVFFMLCAGSLHRFLLVIPVMGSVGTFVFSVDVAEFITVIRM